MPLKPAKPRKQRIARPLSAKPAREPALPIGHFQLENGEEIITGAVLAKYHLFVNALLTHGDLSKASVEAGFKLPSAHKQLAYAQRLMAVPKVRQMLREQYRSLMAKSDITVERVWAELGRLAFADLGQCGNADGILALHEIPEDTRRALVGYKVKRTVVQTENGEIVTEEREVKIGGKNDALEKLMRLHNIGQAAQGAVIVSPEEFLRAMEEGRRRALEHRSPG